MKVFSKDLNSILLESESKLTLLATSLFLGIIFFGLAMLYVSPQFEPIYHGKVFCEMSSSPFDFAKAYPLQNRILAPLLGYLLFLRGDLFFILPYAFTVFLLAAFYFYSRKHANTPLESLLITALLAFSSLVFLPLISPGYTDSVTFFFVFLAFALASQSIQKSSLFFALALLNHESCVFILPALFLYRLSFKANFFTTFIFYLVSCIPLLAYRYYVSQHMATEYSLDFYFSTNNLTTCINTWNLIPSGVFYAFKLLWFFPLFILVESYRRGDNLFLFSILAAMFFPLLQFIIAYDITRMMCISFPAVVLSLFKLKEYWGNEKFNYFTKYLFFFNLLLLPAMVFKEGLFPLNPFWLEWFIHSIQNTIQ